jgi:uncharacterized protein YheU (UPF0270 family)
MIEIPLDRLSPEVLRGVIEEFILREGTDYGVQESSLDNKIAQVRRQLGCGDVLITFDPVTENCTLLTKHQFKRLVAEQVAKDTAESIEDYSQNQGSP